MADLLGAIANKLGLNPGYTQAKETLVGSTGMKYPGLITGQSQPAQVLQNTQYETPEQYEARATDVGNQIKQGFSSGGLTYSGGPSIPGIPQTSPTWNKNQYGEEVKSIGFQGSGEAPWITGESTPGQYQSGSFGSINTPDLSNPIKVSEYVKYMAGMGYDVSGINKKELEQAYNQGRASQYIASKLNKTPTTASTASTSPSISMDTIQKALASGGLSTSPTQTATAPSTGTTGGITGMLGNAGSALTSAIGRAIQPASKAYAQDAGVGLSEEDLLKGGLTVDQPAGERKPFASSEQYTGKGGLGYTLGTMADWLGQKLGLPEFGISERLAGSPTYGTGIASSSKEAGYTIPTIGSVGAPIGGEENLFEETPQEPMLDLGVDTGNYGGGNYAQTQEVSDFIGELLNEILSSSPETYATADTSEMDAWYQEAMQQTGVTESQAALSTINNQIQVVSDLIDQLDKDIAAEAGNFLMTEAQRRRLVASRGQPLRDQLAKLAAGASKYGVAIKDALGMLDQQIKLKQMQSTERLASQKAIEASQQNKIKNLTSLLPYLTPNAGQQLSADEAMKRALLQSQTSKDVANINQGGELF